MAELAFQHQHGAHCESGVTSALLTHLGTPLSEPLAFGIGSGLFFVYFPVERVFGLPTTSYRSVPGTLFTKACKRLGVQMEVRRYRTPQRAKEDLARLLDAGTPVGLQTGIFWLDYLPRRFRFHFNVHNIIVYGRKDGAWLVSDPVFDVPVECRDDSMDRARFSPGFLTPRGRAYFVPQKPVISDERLRWAILQGAAETAHRMSQIPLPIFGWRAIRLLARRMPTWPREGQDPQRALMQLANVVRMQEEIGTGGAGFRYLYAAFLQEAGEKLGEPEWHGYSERLTAIGDRWRDFAAAAARIYKSGKAEREPFQAAAAIVGECAERERELFAELYRVLRPRVKALPRPA